MDENFSFRKTRELSDLTFNQEYQRNAAVNKEKQVKQVFVHSKPQTTSRQTSRAQTSFRKTRKTKDFLLPNPYYDQFFQNETIIQTKKQLQQDISELKSKIRDLRAKCKGLEQYQENLNIYLKFDPENQKLFEQKEIEQQITEKEAELRALIESNRQNSMLYSQISIQQLKEEIAAEERKNAEYERRSLIAEENFAILQERFQERKRKAFSVGIYYFRKEISKSKKELQQHLEKNHILQNNLHQLREKYDKSSEELKALDQELSSKKKELLALKSELAQKRSGSTQHT